MYNCNYHNGSVGTLADDIRRGQTDLPLIHRMVLSKLSAVILTVIPVNQTLLTVTSFTVYLETCQAGNKLASLHNEL